MIDDIVVMCRDGSELPVQQMVFNQFDEVLVNILFCLIGNRSWFFVSTLNNAEAIILEFLDVILGTEKVCLYNCTDVIILFR